MLYNWEVQSNSRTVLRIFLFLALHRRIQTVDILFLVRGRTKRNCDRTFNLLKQKHHKCQIWIYDQAYDALSTHDEVQACETSDFTLRDWCSLTKIFFREFPPRAIAHNHVLSWSMHIPGCMNVQRSTSASSWHKLDFRLNSKPSKRIRAHHASGAVLQTDLTPSIGLVASLDEL